MRGGNVDNRDAYRGLSTSYEDLWVVNMLQSLLIAEEIYKRLLLCKETDPERSYK